MFRLFILLTLLIPGTYLYLRINRLFIMPGYKILFTVIFLILFLMIPLSGSFMTSANNLFQKILGQISGYLLPFFLYVFLAVLVYDLFLLVNYFPQWVSLALRQTFDYKFYTLIGISVLSVLVVIGGVINLNNTQVTLYEVSVPRKNSNLEKLRVAFIADFHIHSGVPVSFIEKYVEEVKSLNPDLMLYGGDIVDDKNIHPELEKITGLLKEINPRFGVFGVLGNHEFYRGHTDGAFFRQAGIVLLNDSIAQVGDSFVVAGRIDEHFGKRKTVQEILGDNIPNLPILMLDHRPTQLEEVSKTSVNAQFSGHTHNGQLFPFNFIIKSMYELGWGYKQKVNTHFFVTSGLRLWGPPVKTTGKSEIIVVDFKFE
ncbi:MAG: metallophosphoesterase [Draconibacterium sp.]